MRMMPLFFLLVVAGVHVLAAGPAKPVIVSQRSLSVNEDGSITIALTDLTVRDPDDIFYPYGFTLKLYEGENYSFDGHTVTPAPNFNGTLRVPVTVNDGTSDSQPFNLIITVNPVNDPPTITGQKDLSTIENIPLAITLSDLIVTDPDNTYPNGFSLQVSSGSNYTVSGNTITPGAGFSGNLAVPVTVNDGTASSAPFNLSVTVVPANKKPKITGQAKLSITKNQSIEIQFSHLQVEDPDSNYPGDFTIILYPDANYTYSGLTVKPAQDFVGTLRVKVAVNDGNSTSDIFNLSIDVKDQITITGQEAISVNEDESVALKLDQLTVYDPNNQFPAGYLLKIDPGDNYTIENNIIKPLPDYFGELKVKISVTNGTYTSPVYDLLIAVIPVNDPPGFTDFPEPSVRFNIGSEPIRILPSLTITDPDDTHLILAEIGIRPEGYLAEHDVLTFTPTAAINAVFDKELGTLTLLGQATLSEYEEALKTIEYNYLDTENPLPGSKVLFVKLNDGKDVSATYEREILVGEDFELDIPTVFTPNEDAANDTWKIKPLGSSERYGRSIIRVFNARGLMVFETSGFEKEWDGSYNGKELPGGTYFYTIDLNLNYATKKITGAVTLLK